MAKSNDERGPEVKISFPTPVEGKAVVHKSSFFATGRCEGFDSLVGVLTNTHTHENYLGSTYPIITYPAWPLALAEKERQEKQEQYWAIWFDVPDVEQGQPRYALKIYRIVAHERLEYHLCARLEHIRFELRHGVTISAPANNDTCCNDPFTAQGTCTGSDLSIKDATMNGISCGSTNIHYPRPGSWIAYWPASGGTLLAPANSPYELDVTGSGNSVAKVTNLTLQVC